MALERQASGQTSKKLDVGEGVGVDQAADAVAAVAAM
jgi:hypothetical protein